jgi:hypothetical protein
MHAIDVHEFAGVAVVERPRHKTEFRSLPDRGDLGLHIVGAAKNPDTHAGVD